MDIWETKVQANDVVKFNSKNTYINVFLKVSKKVGIRGHDEVKVECMTRAFQLINNDRVYKPEESFAVNTFQIINGKYIGEI